jgi:excisionase family DNA binding protein
MLTVKETADFLQMSPMTIYRLAHKGQIPCFKIGDQWRFRVEAINQWIDKKEKSNGNKDKIKVS